MKLTDLDIIVTAPPAPGWGGRYWILIKLTTDTGLIGWGEAYASSVGPSAMQNSLHQLHAYYTIGPGKRYNWRKGTGVHCCGFLFFNFESHIFGENAGNSIFNTLIASDE